MLPYSEQDLLAANVNPATGLATDYLNLFNEAIMLFEMGLDMPDMATNRRRPSLSAEPTIP